MDLVYLERWTYAYTHRQIYMCMHTMYHMHILLDAMCMHIHTCRCALNTTFIPEHIAWSMHI